MKKNKAMPKIRKMGVKRLLVLLFMYCFAMIRCDQQPEPRHLENSFLTEPPQKQNEKSSNTTKSNFDVSYGPYHTATGNGEENNIPSQSYQNNDDQDVNGVHGNTAEERTTSRPTPGKDLAVLPTEQTTPLATSTLSTTETATVNSAVIHVLPTEQTTPLATSTLSTTGTATDNSAIVQNEKKIEKKYTPTVSPSNQESSKERNPLTTATEVDTTNSTSVYIEPTSVNNIVEDQNSSTTPVESTTESTTESTLEVFNNPENKAEQISDDTAGNIIKNTATIVPNPIPHPEMPTEPDTNKNNMVPTTSTPLLDNDQRMNKTESAQKKDKNIDINKEGKQQQSTSNDLIPDDKYSDLEKKTELHEKTEEKKQNIEQNLTTKLDNVLSTIPPTPKYITTLPGIPLGNSNQQSPDSKKVSEAHIEMKKNLAPLFPQNNEKSDLIASLVVVLVLLGIIGLVLFFSYLYACLKKRGHSGDTHQQISEEEALPLQDMGPSAKRNYTASSSEHCELLIKSRL